MGVLCLLVLQTPCDAEPKAADPAAFLTRTYRIPGNDLVHAAGATEHAIFPALPPENAKPEEFDAFIKQSNAALKKCLASQNLTFSPGWLGCYDPQSETLVLRGTEFAHEQAESLLSSSIDRYPTQVMWAVDIVEAPANAALVAMKETFGKSDHTEAFDHLCAKGKVVRTVRGQSKSGRRTSINQGIAAGVPTTDNAEIGTTSPYPTSEGTLGTWVDIEPTVGPGGHVISVVLKLRHHYDHPINVAGGLAFPMASVNMNLAMTSNTSRLLGVWTLDGASEPCRAGFMQVAFLRMSATPVRPLENTHLVQMFKERSEAVEPTPKNADASLLPGMVMHRFKVPPDFLSVANVSDDSAAPADPFTKVEPKHALEKGPIEKRKVTAKTILEDVGVQFPGGSSACFVPSTSELVLRNTPQNMKLAETALEMMGECRPLRKIGLSFYIVQGDAAWLRKLDRETMRLPDHTAVWQEVEEAVAQGKAKVVRALQMDSTPGVRVTHESGIRFLKTKPAEGKGAAEAEPLPFGLRVELDPLSDPDGKTVDVNSSFLYDFAPFSPSQATEPLPSTSRRRAVVQNASVMLTGSIRLISIWKPSGSPELDGDILQAAFLRAEVVPIGPNNP